MVLAIWPGASSAPSASTSSRPVQARARRGRRRTSTLRSPIPRRTISASSSSRMPAASTCWPGATSLPARRTYCPAAGSAASAIRVGRPSASRDSTRQSSTRTTVSSPSGSRAPVMMLQASAACPAIPSPAACSAITASSLPAARSGVQRNANPSIPALSNGGSGRGASTGDASTRPAASTSATASAGSSRQQSRIVASAASNASGSFMQRVPGRAAGSGPVRRRPCRRGGATGLSCRRP